MNPIVILIADGDTFFLGMALASCCLVLLSRTSHFLLRSILRIVGILALGLVVVSSTPFPVWVYGTWIVLFSAGWILVGRPGLARYRSSFPFVFTLLSMTLCLLELPYHFQPDIRVAPGQQVYVIGDSISAGMGTSERNWPEVLDELSELRVTNLAQPGATALSALSQTKGIVAPNSLVLVEIGGNDLFGNQPSAQFQSDLDALLGKIDPSNRIVLFELPLLPFHSGYGQVQRRLAEKYHALLIPKRDLARVIGAAGNTLDGLHLSQQGHNALANRVLNLLKTSERKTTREKQR